MGRARRPLQDIHPGQRYNLTGKVSAHEFAPHIPIAPEKLLKWARSSDLTVIVLWDVQKQTGPWAAPENAFDASKFHFGPAVPTNITFSSSRRFDAWAANRICWKACIGYFNRRAAAAQARDATRTREKRRNRNVDLPSFELLIRLGIVNPRLCFNPEVLLVARSKAAEFREMGAPQDNIESTGMIWTMLVRVHALSDGGMPVALVHSCGELLMMILAKYGARHATVK